MLYQNGGNRAVLDALPERLGRFLDLGCGAGDNTARLAGRFVEAVGVTHDPREREVAAQHFTRVLAHDLDTPLPEALGDGFDVVLCSHVLEHLRWPEQTLTDVRRRMRPGGLLFVALPNLLHYASRARLALGEFRYAEAGLMDRTHLRWFTFATGRELIERAGFEVERAWVDPTFPFWRSRGLLPRGVRGSIEAVAARVSPGLFGAQLLYRARAPRG